MATDGLPPLNAVRAFEAAARRGSFIDAAADLNVTHWAIGKQVRLLEDWLGVPLFERRSRGVALTEEGTELLADVSGAFFRLSEATGKLRRPEVTRRVSGVVRVNVQSSFALRWLFPRLTRFQGQFPYIDVRVSTTSRKLRYIGSAFDIGVRSAPERGAGLRSEPLMADRRRSACSPELLRKRPVETVHDLRHHYDPALRHDALFLVSLAIRSRRRESQELSSTGAGARVSSASMPLIEGDIAAGRLVCPIAAPEWNAGSYELVMNEDRAETPLFELSGTGL